jgi:hypothetical protein
MSVKGKTTKRPNDNQGKLVRHTPNPLSRSCFENCCNLGVDVSQILPYATTEQPVATLVCLAAVGRAHDNETVNVPGIKYSLARYRWPRPSFDSIVIDIQAPFIVVVPDVDRVLPLGCIVHRSQRSP